MKTKRFTLHVTDCPDGLNEDGAVVIYDYQQWKPVLTLHSDYSQLICLEHGIASPFTDTERWLNSLDKESLESEGIPSKEEKVWTVLLAYEPDSDRDTETYATHVTADTANYAIVLARMEMIQENGWSYDEAANMSLPCIACYEGAHEDKR